MVGNNFRITGILSHNIISQHDLLNGLYDNAIIRSSIVNYCNTMEIKRIHYGKIEKVMINNGIFYAEILGMNSTLKNNIGNELYSINCRATFCDTKCRLKEKNFTFHGFIVKNVDNHKILFVKDYDDNEKSLLQKYHEQIKYGLLLSNNTRDIPIASCNIEFNNSIIDGDLILRLQHFIKIGDKFSIKLGCDKSFSTCSQLYLNSLNFRGEPHIPQKIKVTRSNY